MLETIFANPGYLVAGGALISSPIIIHLINRFRFKRMRWAAMEFLLKAQKRTRRRLIIEQIILLLLRCLLVALVVWLVSQFTGWSLGGYESKDGLHIVILDDTLSMNDQWKEKGEGEEETPRTAFDVARKEIIVDKIAKNVGQSTTADRMVILQLSRIALEKDDYQGKMYTGLGDSARRKDVESDLEELKVTKLNVSPLVGLKKAKELALASPESRVTVHLVSDFRHSDWGVPHGKGLHEIVAELAKMEIKGVRLWDAAHPYRGQGGVVPANHDNVSIIDFRAGTRVAGKDMPVTFAVTVANNGTREATVNVAAHNETDGQPMHEVDFNPSMPIKIAANSTATVTFDKRFNPGLKDNESYFANLSARLEDPDRRPLTNDGLPDDNIRYTTIEVRNKVPVLIIDGEGKNGRRENGDSFFLHHAILSVPGASYEIFYGDDLMAQGPSTKALERADLARFPTIFLLNVPFNDSKETAKQLANLEKYVAEGGGVAFFLGPLVNPEFYSSRKPEKDKETGKQKVIYKDDWGLYKEGKGIFPVPLRSTYYPPSIEEPLRPEVTGLPQLLLRDDTFPTIENYPIFGKVFRENETRKFLNDIPIKRYFQVPRGDWKKEPGKVEELATLPNEQDSKNFQKAVLAILANLQNVLDNAEYRAYRDAFKRHRKAIEYLVNPTSEFKAYRLAHGFKEMLNDVGKEKERALFPNLKEFWNLADPQIIALKDQIRQLYDEVQYGDPFVVTRQHGNGRTVAVMSTAGKEWNDWAGGSDGTLIFQPFIWELQNFLSSQSAEANRLVGSTVTILVDSEQYAQKNRQLKMVRFFHKPKAGEKAVPVQDTEIFGKKIDEGKDNLLTFTFDKNFEPGLYVAHLHYEDADPKAAALASWGQVFNVDAEHEGRLARIGSEEVDKNLPAQALEKGLVKWENPQSTAEELINKQSNMSKWPWIFLLFLFVLVAEQALAVHLSFHLKGGDAELHAPQTARAPAQAA